ncbi:MAG: Mur ligase domain-containing protein, partial [Desulfatiglandales bacterium]
MWSSTDQTWEREADLRLSELFKGISIQIPQRLYELEINGLKVNSKDVKPGDLFVAVKGTKTDGHLFIPEAISK